ncbi:MAG: FxLYD domain-containing protein [Dehalococcoidia bacterium]
MDRARCRAGGLDTRGWAALRRLLRRQPKQRRGLANLRFRIAVFDAAGTLVESDSATLDWLALGATAGVGASVQLSKATAADVRVSAEQVRYLPFAPLEVSDARMVTDRGAASITGTLRNPTNRTLEHVRLDAVYFDDGGTVIGGSQWFLDRAPATTDVAVRMPVFDRVRPARVEVHASVTNLTRFQ